MVNKLDFSNELENLRLKSVGRNPYSYGKLTFQIKLELTEKQKEIIHNTVFANFEEGSINIDEFTSFEVSVVDPFKKEYDIKRNKDLLNNSFNSYPTKIKKHE